MSEMNRDNLSWPGDTRMFVIIGIISFVLTVLVKTVVRRDPADSGYWYLGLFTLSAIAGALVQIRPWRGAFAVILPQLVFPLFSNLGPIAMVFIAVLSIPSIVAAYIG